MSKKRLPGKTSAQSCNAYWKHKAFKRLGGYQCECCEEYRKPFLTIDHVRGSGKVHREQFGGHASFYKWIATTEEEVDNLLQVLCMNCNWAKRHGPCPHELDEQKENFFEAQELKEKDAEKALINEHPDYVMQPKFGYFKGKDFDPPERV